MKNNESSTGDPHGMNLEPLENDEKITAQKAIDSAGVGLFQVKLIILGGLMWMARGFEMVVVKCVIPFLACTWSMERWQGALLNTVMFASATFGCVLYGMCSDKYGRKTALCTSLMFLFAFGAVSAGLPNYTWFIVFRAVAAFSVGCFPQMFVLYCEFFPSNTRGRATYVLSFFWVLGVVIMLWVLYGTVGMHNGWRVFVAIGTIPTFLAMCLLKFFPESFRYLMVTGNYITANSIMAKMTKVNGKKGTTQLQRLPSMRPRNLLLDFFKMRSSILFCLIGCATSISFFGLAAITPHLIHEVADVENKLRNISSFDFMGSQYKLIACIRSMSREEFLFRVWTTALDFPSFVIYMILVDMINRKILLCVSNALSSLFIFLIFVPTSIRILYVIFIYCARTLLLGQFDLILLMVAETFPTSHRGTAVGFEVAFFCLGPFLCPYINHGLLSHKLTKYIYTKYLMLYVYGALTFLCSVLCWGLKHETRGRELQDILENNSEEHSTEGDKKVIEEMMRRRYVSQQVSSS